MRNYHLMLCITANDQTDSNKFDSEHKDRDSNFAKTEKKEEFYSSMQTPF